MCLAGGEQMYAPLTRGEREREFVCVCVSGHVMKSVYFPP